MEKKERKSSTRHHIIPRANKDLFDNLNAQENIHHRHEKPHTVHHARQDMKHPQQTLEDYSFFMNVMSPKARELYQALIAMNIGEFYSDKFINGGKSNNRKRTNK